MSIHDFDMARWLMAAVVEVFAQGAVDPAIATIGDIVPWSPRATSGASRSSTTAAMPASATTSASRHSIAGHGVCRESAGQLGLRRDAEACAAPMYHSFHDRYADSFTAECWRSPAQCARVAVAGVQRDARDAAGDRHRCQRVAAPRPVAIDPTWRPPRTAHRGANDVAAAVQPSLI